MTRTDKAREEIKKREAEIRFIENEMDNLKYLDWKDMENKYYLIETFVTGIFRTMHILKVEKNKLIYEEGCLDDGFISTFEFDHITDIPYMKYTEITKKEYLEKNKGLKDLGQKEGGRA